MINALSGNGPLYSQVYCAIRDAIVSGQMPKGSLLPSTRSLVRQFGVSRTTVVSAYEQLIAEGYAVGRPRNGTYVASTPPEEPAARPLLGAIARVESPRAHLRLSEYGQAISLLSLQGVRLDLTSRSQATYDFQWALPSIEDFPVRVWRKLMVSHTNTSLAAHSPPEGSERLRSAIANHLIVARGVRCDLAQIFIVNGTQQGLDLAARLLINRDDVAAVEDPHPIGYGQLLESLGARKLAVPVDEFGIQVERLEEAQENVRAVFVTPSHQFPTGAILDLERRLALLRWCTARGSYILEDDCGGEYRYENRPLESLQGLDQGDCVIHIGSFSRTLFPALKIGYVIVPRSLVPVFRKAKWIVDRQASTLVQDVLAEFMEQHHLEHYLRRLRVHYERRRSTLLEAISQEFGTRARTMGTGSGVHVMLDIIELDSQRVDELAARALRAGVAVYPLNQHAMSSARRKELLLGYSALSEHDIRQGVKILGVVLAANAGHLS